MYLRLGRNVERQYLWLELSKEGRDELIPALDLVLAALLVQNQQRVYQTLERQGRLGGLQHLTHVIQKR